MWIVLLQLNTGEKERAHDMAYVNPNYRYKKQFLQAVKEGIKHYTFNPSNMFPTVENGHDTVEGPHFPKAHSWYSAVKVENGVVVSAT